MPDGGLETRFWKLVMKWYPAIRHTTSPFTRLREPVSEARDAIVTSCGVHLASDAPFDLKDVRGDPSFREIPAEATQTQLAITHAHDNHRVALQDINVVFPIERLHAQPHDDRASKTTRGKPPRHEGSIGKTTTVTNCTPQPS